MTLSATVLNMYVYESQFHDFMLLYATFKWSGPLIKHSNNLTRITAYSSLLPFRNGMFRGEGDNKIMGQMKGRNGKRKDI
jgi:hypothetical protein